MVFHAACRLLCLTSFIGLCDFKSPPIESLLSIAKQHDLVWTDYEYVYSFVNAHLGIFYLGLLLVKML